MRIDNATTESIQTFYALVSFLMFRDFFHDLSMEKDEHADIILADETSLIIHFGGFTVLNTMKVDGVVHLVQNESF